MKGRVGRGEEFGTATCRLRMDSSHPDSNLKAEVDTEDIMKGYG